MFTSVLFCITGTPGDQGWGFPILCILTHQRPNRECLEGYPTMIRLTSGLERTNHHPGKFKARGVSQQDRREFGSSKPATSQHSRSKRPPRTIRMRAGIVRPTIFFPPSLAGIQQRERERVSLVHSLLYHEESVPLQSAIYK